MTLIDNPNTGSDHDAGLAPLKYLVQRILQAIGLRGLRASALVIAASADAMHTLGDVDHLEVRAEGPDHRLGLLRRAARQAVGQVGQRRRVLAAGNGPRAHTFHVVEERL